VEVRLEDCRFERAVNLSHSEWKRDFSLSGSEFNALDLSYSSVSGSLWMEGVRVTAKAYLSFLRIGRNLEAEKASFVGTSVASFNSIAIGGYARFDEAVFAGGLDLIMSTVGTNLYISQLQLTSETAAAQFDKIRVGDSVYATQPSIFNGPASFAGGATRTRYFFNRQRIQESRRDRELLQHDR
jgi:hypothetical protein